MSVVKLETLLLVGSQSIHTERFLNGIAPFVQRIVLVSNAAPKVAPANLISVIHVDFRLLAWRTAATIRQALRDFSPQLIHVQQANSVAWHTRRAAVGSGIPMVLSCWGSDILRLPQQNRLMRQMVRGNLRAAHAWTADSQELLAAAAQLAGDTRPAARILFGLDTLPPAPEVQGRPLRILSCRLHKPLYRVESILRAFAQLCAQGAAEGWVLEIAAQGEQTAALQQLAQTLNLAERVVFSGFLAHATLLTHYQTARVFVSVPESDGTPASLLEAMAYGCLPVLSNLPANREWVVDAKNGVLVHEMAALAADLLRAMQWATSPAYAQTAAENHQLMCAQAGLSANLAVLNDLYRQILAVPV